MTMRISPEVEIAFSLATREASRRRHEFVTIEHLLYALLFDEETAEVLRHAGGDTPLLKKKLERFLDEEIEALPEDADTSPTLSLGFQRVVGRAAMHVQSSGSSSSSFSRNSSSFFFSFWASPPACRMTFAVSSSKSSA